MFSGNNATSSRAVISFSNPVSIPNPHSSFFFFPFPRFRRSPLFSDNASVYYKPHSLASGGIGTVRNMRSKRART